MALTSLLSLIDCHINYCSSAVWLCMFSKHTEYIYTYSLLQLTTVDVDEVSNKNTCIDILNNPKNIHKEVTVILYL